MVTFSKYLRRATIQFFYLFDYFYRDFPVILLYHSIGSDLPQSIPETMFEDQLELLDEHFEVLTLRELKTSECEARGSDPPACITFDDGYLDNYESVLPLLEKYSLKATFFITTQYLGREMETSFGNVPMMNETQLQEIADKGHEIGAHTRHHENLTQLQPDQIRSEVGGSKRDLEEFLDLEVSSFAYPKGNYHSDAKKIVRDLGFRQAVTTNEGLVRRPVDWFELPRTWIHKEMTENLFLAKLSPAIDCYQRLKSMVR